MVEVTSLLEVVVEELEGLVVMHPQILLQEI
jgi:hypothetical protein